MYRNLFVIAMIPFLMAAGTSISHASTLTPEEQNTIEVYEALLSSVVTVLAENIGTDGSPAESPAGFSLGSGFAIEPGLVVTNYHVIADAIHIEVVLHDGRRQIAAIVGTAPGLDLAVLRVSFSTSDLPPAPLGTASQLRVGQKALTISSPLGLHHSVSVGVVSSLYRELPGLDLGPNLIQFDAPVNQGQSGGPLVNSAGLVIGVTTAKADQAEAIGFAIPVDVVVSVLPNLKTMGHAFKPQIGFSGTTVTPELATLFDLPTNHGVLVESTKNGGVAARAGMRAGDRHVYLGGKEYVVGGDILIAVNDIPLRNTGDLVRHLLASRPGDMLIFELTDGSRLREIAITVPEMIH